MRGIACNCAVEPTLRA